VGIFDEQEGGEVMRALVLASLRSGFGASVAADLVAAHDKLIGEFRKGDAESALNAAGKFVEHALRAIEYARTGTAPSEIKSVSATVKTIENDGKLPESLRLLAPRIAAAMVFDIRSKRGAAQGNQPALHRCRSGGTGRLLDSCRVHSLVPRRG